MSDPVEVFTALGGQFAPNLDDYAAGRISVTQIQCLLCQKAPCVCGPCPDCQWHGAPDNCQACGRTTGE